MRNSLSPKNISWNQTLLSWIFCQTFWEGISVISTLAVSIYVSDQAKKKKKFREINSFVTSLVKSSISRKRFGFRKNRYRVLLLHWEKIIHSNFFSSNAAFTIVLSKKCTMWKIIEKSYKTQSPFLQKKTEKAICFPSDQRDHIL